MRSNHVQQAIRNRGLVVLLGGFMVVAFPSSDAATQGVATKAAYKQCVGKLKEFMRANRFRPNDKVYSEATQHCTRGDLNSAKRVVIRAQPPVPQTRPTKVLSEKECVEQLNDFIEESRFRPNDRVYSEATQHCTRGDLNSAITVITRRR